MLYLITNTAACLQSL